MSATGRGCGGQADRRRHGRYCWARVAMNTEGFREDALNAFGSKAFRLTAALVAVVLAVTVVWWWSRASPKVAVRPLAVMHPAATRHEMPATSVAATNPLRSEERRVGKE